jgi:hypothetical protein
VFRCTSLSLRIQCVISTCSNDLQNGVQMAGISASLTRNYYLSFSFLLVFFSLNA